MSGEYRERFNEIELKWQAHWEERKAFAAPARPTGEPFYCLEMLPYPSGRLHMGHVRNYSIGDAVARFQRMRGREVLHPMGWDSFGLPAENAAIKHGIPPAPWTEKNIETMRAQLKRLGLAYDWSREIAAHRPDYYRWNQWFFLKMLERDLAYRSRRSVNWCASCHTVLANEQVEGGRCWRCDSEVVLKELDQWFLRITRYAAELHEELDNLPGWPERVRTMQRNWIGRSEGSSVRFPLLDASGRQTEEALEVFTTRLDTIFGATFCVVAAAHPFLRRVPASAPERPALDAFIRTMESKPGAHQDAEPEEREGLDTGLRVHNPYSGETLRVFTSNFVLMGYGTGAIMAVPAHDERDHEFATRYNLPIRTVVARAGEKTAAACPAEAMVEDGILIESGPYTGQSSDEARRAMTRDGEKGGFARGRVNYRILDWGISRQRFWGTPIPIVYCEGCGTVPVAEKDLPVLLPDDAPLTGAGGSPLDRVEAFVKTVCPRCGGPGRRETDTMDTFFDSSWYFFRYCDPRNGSEPYNREVVDSWFPIDLYIGGITHATMHLIYCRFFAKVMRDLGLTTAGEPVRNLVCQGMVLKGGTAMSKSKGNIVDPDEMIQRYGADTTRLFTLFAAPPVKDLEWDERGVDGCFRFLDKVWRLLIPRAAMLSAAPLPGAMDGRDDPRRAALRRKVHQTIRRITIDIDRRLHLNTPVAAVMELLNESQVFVRDFEEDDAPYLKEVGWTMALLLQPFAPHISEELWSALGGGGDAVDQRWPDPDEEWLHEETVEMVVQVNGRVRSRLRVSPSLTEKEALDLARADARVAAHLSGKTIRKTIYLPGRLLNIVVG